MFINDVASQSEKMSKKGLFVVNLCGLIKNDNNEQHIAVLKQCECSTKKKQNQNLEMPGIHSHTCIGHIAAQHIHSIMTDKTTHLWRNMILY